MPFINYHTTTILLLYYYLFYNTAQTLQLNTITNNAVHNCCFPLHKLMNCLHIPPIPLHYYCCIVHPDYHIVCPSLSSVWCVYAFPNSLASLLCAISVRHAYWFLSTLFVILKKKMQQLYLDICLIIFPHCILLIKFTAYLNLICNNCNVICHIIFNVLNLPHLLNRICYTYYDSNVCRITIPRASFAYSRINFRIIIRINLPVSGTAVSPFQTCLHPLLIPIMIVSF